MRQLTRQAYLKIAKKKTIIYLSYALDDVDEEFLYNHLLDNNWEIKNIEEEEFDLWHSQKGKDPSINSYIITNTSLATTLLTL